MTPFYVSYLSREVVSNHFFNYLYRMKRFILCFRLISTLVLSIVIMGNRVGVARAASSPYACLMWQNEYGSVLYDTNTGVLQESSLVADDSAEAQSTWTRESPDGKWVAFYWGTDQVAFITFANRLNLQRLVIPINAPYSTLYGWSADNNYFALDEVDQRGNHTLVILAMPSLKEVFSEQWHPVTSDSIDNQAPEPFVNWSNTGHQLAFMRYDSSSGQVQITIVSPTNTATSYTLSSTAVDNSADYLAKKNVIITWSPDDQQISLEASNLPDDQQLSVYDIRTARVHRITNHNILNTSQILWAGQGHSLFYLDRGEIDASVEAYRNGQSKVVKGDSILVKGAPIDTEFAPDKMHFILSFSSSDGLTLTYTGLDVNTLQQTMLVTTDNGNPPVWLDNDHVAVPFTDGLAWGNINGSDWHQNHDFRLPDNYIKDVNDQAIAIGDNRNDGSYVGVINWHTQESHFFRVANDRTNVWTISLSPDGKTLAVLTDEDNGYQIELFTTDGKPNKIIPINRSVLRYAEPQLLWSPDSLKLLLNNQLIDINSSNIQARTIDIAAEPDVIWIKCDSTGVVF